MPQTRKQRHFVTHFKDHNHNILIFYYVKFYMLYTSV